MKSKYIPVPSMILVIILTLTMLGYSTLNVKTKTDINRNKVLSMIGKPTYESTVDNLKTKVWVIEQVQQHKRMMEEKSVQMNDGMVLTSNKTMMEGTHFLLLDLINPESGKEIANVSVKVQIVCPSKKDFSVNLKAMMSHFGSELKLEEKGEYLFTINFDIGAIFKTMHFKYAVI